MCTYRKEGSTEGIEPKQTMAGVLENLKVMQGLRWAFRKCDFECKKIGPTCNASRPRLFTKVECEAHPIWCGEGQGGVSVDFVCLFETAFQLISNLKLGKLKYEEVDGHFQKAFDILDKFMASISTHETSLGKLLKNGDKLTEADVTAALAEHLLVKLAPRQSYTIDKTHRLFDNQVCKCGCGAKIKFGDTGIGNEEVWHGFVDIIFSSHEELESEPTDTTEADIETAVVTVLDIDTSAVIEPVTKKFKHAPDQEDNKCSSHRKENLHPPGGNYTADIEIDLDDSADIDDQTIAQAIVCSMLQKKRHPELQNFLIPTIVISSTKFRIIMYDAENDVLLQSNTYDLFVSLESSELSVASVVVLWLVLHYRIFCSGLKKNNFYEGLDLGKVKSGFKDRITLECVDSIYTDKLKSCVASFPKVDRKTKETRGLNPLFKKSCKSMEFFWS